MGNTNIPRNFCKNRLFHKSIVIFKIHASKKTQIINKETLLVDLYGGKRGTRKRKISITRHTVIPPTANKSHTHQWVMSEAHCANTKVRIARVPQKRSSAAGFSSVSFLLFIAKLMILFRLIKLLPYLIVSYCFFVYQDVPIPQQPGSWHIPVLEPPQSNSC